MLPFRDMSIGAHVLRALFIFFGLLLGIGAVVLLTTEVDAATSKEHYSCDAVVNPTSFDPDKLCDTALQTRAQGAQALATVALAAFVAAAAVSIGGRHRFTVQSEARNTQAASPAPSGYAPAGGGAPPRA